MSIFERYTNKIKKTDTCHRWISAKTKDGYGVMWLNGKIIRAHRFSYIINKGNIPKGLLVCHTCDIRDCVNPDHLFLGTYKDNNNDRDKKNRTKTLKGGECTMAKIGEKDVLEIRKKYIPFKYTGLQIAREYGISQPNVSAIITRRSWKHV